MLKHPFTSILIASLLLFTGCSRNSRTTRQAGESSDKHTSVDYSKSISISKDVLADKIKGGWAGQVIGCTYGGPTEFRYQGTMIQDYVPIEWDSAKMKWYFNNAPGLYDDVYMDLTFVSVFEKEGIEAPALAHAEAFAHAEYMLWHANQVARYNILNGMAPPASGYWENNPHADDIDFQIEADFAGLMSPGMPNTASDICDKVGHIMNYGDGWYGGVFVASMYSLAFLSNNIPFIVGEALKSIPEESDFHRCISDVINWHAQFPDDWKQCWFEVERKWSSDIGCPDGVFQAFDIDAKINAAYIVIGLLYGEGDYGKSIDISTRCGQDSDCNPATLAGILGTLLGYSNIPDYWKQGLDQVEDLDFKYTTLSLNDVYKMSLKQAIQVIKQNHGSIAGDLVTLQPQPPQAVRYEKSFEGHYPVKIISIAWEDQTLSVDHTAYEFEFEGKGFVLSGNSGIIDDRTNPDQYIHKVKVYIDDQYPETVQLPTDFTIRRHDICWKYNLSNTRHRIRIELINPKTGYQIKLSHVLVYSDSNIHNVK